MDIPNQILKYLNKQNNTRWSIEISSNKKFENIIVIPAIDEYENAKRLIDSISKNSPKYLTKTLILFVVNNIESEHSSIIKENTKLIEYLNKQMREDDLLNIAYIDASSNGKSFDNKNGGVGYARKIGFDLSLMLFDYTDERKRIFISLDADCLVSKNYLEVITEKFNKEKLEAGVVKYEHTMPQNLAEKSAIVNYEIFLRYYVLSLKFSNSPFAFHSIGSTIVFDAETYVKVGGMNKRKAGEDFYFLEKLAKITNISQIGDTTVYPSSRVSTRTPFGTGPRVMRFLEDPSKEYQLYSPVCFEILKKWLFIFYDNSISTNTKELLIGAKKINKSLHDFLVEHNFENSWNSILSNTKGNEQLNRQRRNWMDGFKTLRLIHYLRDTEYPNINMFLALNELLNKMDIQFKTCNKNVIPPISIQVEYLKLLRILT